MFDEKYETCTFDDFAEIYDVEYPETADHEFLRKMTATSSARAILEIPCGVGRNIGVLSENGANLTAADQSREMIEQLKKGIEKIRYGHRIKPVVAEMSTLDLGCRFDLIVVPREAFQLITSIESAKFALRAFKKHLNQNGTLLIDMANFVNDQNADPGLQPDYYKPQIRDGLRYFNWERKTADNTAIKRYCAQYHVSKDIYKTIFYYEIKKNGFDRSYKALLLRFRIWETDQFQSLAKEQGLVVTSVYGNYQKKTYFKNGARSIFLLTHEKNKPYRTVG